MGVQINVRYPTHRGEEGRGEIQEPLKKLKVGMTASIDGITAEMLKDVILE